jgi:ribosomal protein L3 glutamine methyltransferase
MNESDNLVIELVSIRDYIRYAVSCFHEAKLYFGHGTDNAWDEAVTLILTALHLPPTTDRVVLEAKITLAERQNIVKLLQSRINERKPTAYLVKEAWFMGLPFYIDERVLIPRSPIAELILKKFEPWAKYEQVNTILDIGTGSGCIAIACAHIFPHAEIDASDIDEEAMKVAKINIDAHRLQHQIHLYHSDVFANIPAKKYDIIISNPPYVANSEMEGLPAEYLHEPRNALFAGEDGLNIVNKILAKAKEYLTDHGVLIVEVGNSEHAVREKYSQLPLMWLEFEHGGGGVFLISRDQLEEQADA